MSNCVNCKKDISFKMEMGQAVHFVDGEFVCNSYCKVEAGKNYSMEMSVTK